MMGRSPSRAVPDWLVFRVSGRGIAAFMGRRARSRNLSARSSALSCLHRRDLRDGRLASQDDKNDATRRHSDSSACPGLVDSKAAIVLRRRFQQSGQLFFEVVAKNAAHCCSTFVPPHLGHFTLFFWCSARLKTVENFFPQDEHKYS
jgi:hypothetical protein